jgi:branched-chain amino acid transport system permease protein
MNYFHQMKPSIKSMFQNMSQHPFFGVILTTTSLLLLQVLGILGIINPSTINLITPVLIYYIVSLGYLLLLGYAGLASLGTAGFIGLNAYIVAHFAGNLGLSVELAFIAGIVVSLVLGAIIGFISLRIQGLYLAIITLGISEILLELFKNLIDITRGTAGFNLFKLTFLGFEMKQTDRFFISYYIIVILLGVLMIMTINLIQSPTGRAMLALKNSPSAAQAMGISLLKYRLMAFMIATFTAGLGGLLYFINKLVSHPNSWGIALSLNILATVVIGGMKSIYGVLFGAFIVFGINDLILKNLPFFSDYPSAYFVLNGLLIMLVVMFYPGGLVRFFKDLSGLVKKGFHVIKKKLMAVYYGK